MSPTAHHRPLRRAAFAALCVAAAAALTACGGEAKAGGERKKEGLAGESASALADKAFKATKAAPSMTVGMEAMLDGAPMTYRMATDDEGRCAGTMTLDGGTVELVKSDGTAYLKYDDAFWKAQGEDGRNASEAIGDRWLKAEADGPEAEDIVGACDLDEVLAGFEGKSAAEKGGETEVDGVPAVVLTEKDGAETATVYVATQGEPYILKVVTKGGEEPVTITFSDFGKPVPAKTPSAEETVDLATLGG